jgi:hypothetical protein
MILLRDPRPYQLPHIFKDGAGDDNRPKYSFEIIKTKSHIRDHTQNFIMPTILRHQGPWNTNSRQHPALKFIETYSTEICDDLSLPFAPTRFFSPTCSFYDTSNVTYTGATNIIKWMQGLFAPFSKLDFECINAFVIDWTSDQQHQPKYIVTAEFNAHYWFKGDPDRISVPRIMIFEIGSGSNEDAADGLQYTAVRLYWNTAILKDERLRRINGSS